MNEEISGLHGRLMGLSDEFEEAARDESAYSGYMRAILFSTAQELNHLAVALREGSAA